jgi:dolichol-phosphate mannosyltransferase
MMQTAVMGVDREPTLVPELYSSDTKVSGPEFTIILPTRNEQDNILPVCHALCRTLQGAEWEAIFVDDDSQDVTPEAVRRPAHEDRRVCCIHMLNVLMTEPVDVVVGGRYVEHGSIGSWDRCRAWLSNFATRLGRRLLRITIADPMSGFFMVRREAFQGSARRLSNIGFKILLDILASSPRPLRVKEIPFHFRERHMGESKIDTLIGLEYLMLLVDKLIGHVIPIRFVLFALVGGLGLLVHLAVLWLCLGSLQLAFAIGQTVVTGVAMVGS